MMRYAEIVVNLPISPPTFRDDEKGLAPPYAWLDHAFTYSVPDELAHLSPGHIVWVPFGPRQVQGVVVGMADETAVQEVRPVLDIAHEQPLLSPRQLDLARWISHRYLAPLSECVWMQLPPGIEEKLETVYSLASTLPEEENLGENQRAVLEQVKASPRGVRLAPHLRQAAGTLVQRGYLVRSARLRPGAARPKQVRAIRLCVEPEHAKEALSRLPRASARLGPIVEFLAGEQMSVWVSAVYAATGAQLADLKRLEQAGIVRLEQEEVVRDPLQGQQFGPNERPELTRAQDYAFRRVLPSLRSAETRVFLLHGVTGSGKTEIYLRAIAEVIAQGRQAIALVPEIALTPQTIQRFGARFERIGIIHSELSHGERYDTWRRAREGKLDLVVGPRSALFAPLPRLGLIVIDEEHEPSYKQESEPLIRLPAFHTREVAIELARLAGAPVILGSATPDVETYWRAQQGEFELLELPRRILAHGPASTRAEYQELPPVQIVDLREELRAGNTSVFSRPLHLAMRTVLAAGQQVILFLNRRGAATSVVCRSCGEPVRCLRCNNPYTLHEFPGESEPELVCHHCGKQRKMPRICPTCESSRIRGLGLGTEKLEQLVRSQFPGARTLRWDWDMARDYASHERILSTFREGGADVLIGTQMVAKGLDLPRVTLVGAVNADTGLNLPDFRAGERTFQLLTQVAGRAGRSALGGRVIIQTFSPGHYAIQAVAGHEYAPFYEQEESFRRTAGYPPFRPLIRLLSSGSPEHTVRESAERLGETLRDRIRRLGLGDAEVMGPAPAFFKKWHGEYRYHLLLRGRACHELISRFPIPPGWRVDVDPMSLL